MVSSPITSWQIDGETMETVTDLILGGSKITADDTTLIAESKTKEPLDESARGECKSWLKTQRSEN